MKKEKAKVHHIGSWWNHLYITTDEEIKEGDWYLHNQKPTGLRIQKCVGNNLPMDASKIIASTDPKLRISEDYKLVRDSDHMSKISKPLPQIPQSFIEEYCKAGGIDKVLVEYKQSLSPLDRFDFIPKTDSNNCIIIHPVEEKMVSEIKAVEVIKRAIKEARLPNRLHTEEQIENWIKENL